MPSSGQWKVFQQLVCASISSIPQSKLGKQVFDFKTSKSLVWGGLVGWFWGKLQKVLSEVHTGNRNNLLPRIKGNNWKTGSFAQKLQVKLFLA